MILPVHGTAASALCADKLRVEINSPTEQFAEEDARWDKLADAFLGERRLREMAMGAARTKLDKRLEEEVQSTLVEFEEHSRKRTS